MRAFLTGLCLLTCFLFSIGQSNFFQVQGGPGIGWLSGNDFSAENQTIRSLPVIGVEYAGFLNENSFLSIGADFMKKGAWEIGIQTLENNDTVTTTSFTSDYKYMVIPFLMNKAVGSEKVMFTMGGGFFLGVLFQHQHEVNTGILNIRLTENDTKNYNMLDFGLQVRLGLRAKIDATHFFLLSLNHQMGLLNTTSKTLVGGGGLRTNASFVQAGFAFLL